MTRRMAFVVILGIALAVTSCSSTDPPEAEDSAATAATDPTSTSTAPSTTTSVDVSLDLGDTFTTQSGNELTVYELRANTPNAEPPPQDVLPNGMTWSSADVELCRSADTTSGPTEADAWQLWTDQGGRIDIASTIYRNALVPAWDYSTTEVPIAPGQCLRGWALFEVPPGAVVESAVFINTDEPLPEWEVSP